MITYNDGIFIIETENTSYIFSVENTGFPEHIYYGRKLMFPLSSLLGMREKHLKAPHMAARCSKEYSEFSLSDTLLEFSTEGMGDYKVPLAAVSLSEKGERTLSLKYDSYKITDGIVRMNGLRLPQAIATGSEAETLSVTYRDTRRKIALITYYTSFYKADVITRRSVIVNESSGSITIRSLLSSSLDLRARGVKITSFSGRWGKEKQIKERVMDEGEIVVESRTIQSGETDPTIIIENGKDTYLMSLIYSGAFRLAVTETHEGITHITTGINPDLFTWKLESGEHFESPEAVLAYSDGGRIKAGNLMKKFIENHIRRGFWKDKMKPILLDTWSALSYDPDERDVLKMAKEANELGFEGIVIADGWFGARRDSTSSLGDWYADTKHFPSGIKSLSNEIHYMGLMFGLWFEVEGISERSILYKSHPDWIVGRNANESVTAKNEFILDLSREDVQEWAIDTLSKIIDGYKIDYIRWSLSRFQGDLWSNGSGRDSGEFMHRYLTGLYRVLDTITKTFPKLYIEGASAGGMRFDMGMLSYMPSILTSENPDPLGKLSVIEGTGMIYPLSVMTNIITESGISPARKTDRETQFNVFSFGVLDYSLNPMELSSRDKIRLVQQIDFYVGYRQLFQYGTFTLQEDNEERTVWTVSDGDSSTILMLYYLKKGEINRSAEKLYVECANENYYYSFIARTHIQSEIEDQIYPQEMECYNISGDALKWAGVTLVDNSSGNGWEDGMRALRDNTTRLYIIKKEERK